MKPWWYRMKKIIIIVLLMLIILPCCNARYYWEEPPTTSDLIYDMLRALISIDENDTIRFEPHNQTDYFEDFTIRHYHNPIEYYFLNVTSSYNISGYNFERTNYGYELTSTSHIAVGEFNYQWFIKGRGISMSIGYYRFIMLIKGCIVQKNPDGVV